jgi:hypothetical protein
VDRDEWEVDGGSGGLPPLAVRQALAAVLADRLPLAADAVLVGMLGAEQLYALEEGVQQLTREGHGLDVIAELERRLVGLASARRGVDLAGPAAEYRAGLGGDVSAEEVGSGPQDPSSDAGVVGAGVRPNTDRGPAVPVAGTGRAPAPPAHGEEARDGAARCPGRGIRPPWGRATARGPPPPDGSACAAARPVIGCAS